MRILALEPYYGGSHKDFLDAWASGSVHDFDLETLPANKWKWRMRHSALTFARRIAISEAQPDLLFCTDMVPLAELVGLLPPTLRGIPTVLYFHENQLTYPVQVEQERDLHFALNNVASAAAATEVWFNSAFHRDDLLAAIGPLLDRMPDHRPLHVVDSIEAKARVMHPGYSPIVGRREDAREQGPLRLLWCARWEFDKHPEVLFSALRRLRNEHPRVEFRLDVIGESFERAPSVFERAHEELGEHIGRWGFQPTRAEYERALFDADVVISTAGHEFFGIAVVEAMAAGCFPLFPDRLVYPELLADLPPAQRREHLYDGDEESLCARLAELAVEVEQGWPGLRRLTQSIERRFSRRLLVPKMDRALERLAGIAIGESGTSGCNVETGRA